MTGMDPRLEAVLVRQRARGLLGPGPLVDQRNHSHAFAAIVGDEPRRALDLGSGGGVPGLVLATECWIDAELVLLDANQRRCTFLELGVADLALGDRVQVRWARAEEAGHDPTLRGCQDVVVARSFGPPALTAECAAPLLEVGGVLVVSEPPTGPEDRWDEVGLARVGLAWEQSARSGGAWYTRLRQVTPCPGDHPRPARVAARRPLF